MMNHGGIEFLYRRFGASQPFKVEDLDDNEVCELMTMVELEVRGDHGDRIRLGDALVEADKWSFPTPVGSFMLVVENHADQDTGETATYSLLGRSAS